MATNCVEDQLYGSLIHLATVPEEKKSLVTLLSHSNQRARAHTPPLPDISYVTQHIWVPVAHYRPGQGVVNARGKGLLLVFGLLLRRLSKLSSCPSPTCP